MTIGELQELLRQFAPETAVVVSCLECGELDIDRVELENRESHVDEAHHPLVVITCD